MAKTSSSDSSAKYIPPCPTTWVGNLMDVNDRSVFAPPAKKLISDALSKLHSDLERL